MQETFTQNHLLESIYNELDGCVDFKLKKELLTNTVLAEEYRELKKAVSLLNQNELSPKSSSVNAILNRSKRKEVELV